MMESSADRPYIAEYSKSARASCKVCKNQISKDVLRLGVMVQSRFADMKVPNWYHHECFFKKQRPKSVGDIAGFENLRWDDQTMIKGKVDIADAGPSSGGSSKKRKGAAVSQHLKDFLVEYAKSNRSTCRGCESTIAKGTPRISKKDYESESALAYGPVDRWFHLECFAKQRDELEYFDSGKDLPGFKTLSAEDQKSVAEALPKQDKKGSDDVDSVAKKIKVENNVLGDDAEANGPDQASEQKTSRKRGGPKTKAQGKKADSKTVVKEETNDVNNAAAAKKTEKLLQKQNEEFFKFRDLLKSNLKKPELIELLEFNNQEVPVGIETILDQLADAMTFGALAKCEVCDGGQFVYNSGVGYKCTGNVTEYTKCQNTTLDPKRSKFKIPSELSEDHSFLASYKVAPKKRVINITAVPTVRPTKTDAKVSDKKSSSRWKSASASKMTVQMKGGGTLVDPECEMGDVAHVLEQARNKFGVVLSLTDIQKGKNSYYRLQVLESDNKYSGGHRYWVFRAWGRIGTKVGNKKTEEFESKEEAVSNFKELYLEKTGNSWENRDNFKKVAGCYVPMDIQYVEDETQALMQPCKVESKLPVPVQNFIKMIFDKDEMKNVMLQFELDLEKMPLGKISRHQIQKAYTVLTELQELLKTSGPDIKFLDASNRFYTLVPHDFGINNAPVIRSDDVIKQKIEMLDSLMEIEIAYSMIGASESDDPELNIIDVHYKKLKTDFSVLERDTEEFVLIEQYLKNTHAETHSQYSLEIMDVFKISREGEDSRFKPFRKLSNRHLLWHGSRVTNFAGILSQGLRIAPPEAPATGYMFGKGIYFADMVSKSANYCFTSQLNHVGVLLLCDVALGSMYERTNADYITKLPAGKHSCKGVGMTHPDPSGVATLGDIRVPCGKPVKTKAKSSLLYNEYIVYDPAQVNIKYLLTVDFKYKYKY